MKKYLSAIMMGALLVVGLFVIEVQSSMRNECKANIPFDFYVRDAKLPAGEYTVREGNSGASILLIQKDDGNEGTFVYAVGATPKNSGDSRKLVFHRYNEDYFLSEIWGSEGDEGHFLPITSKERELEKGVSRTSKADSRGYREVAIALK